MEKYSKIMKYARAAVIAVYATLALPSCDSELLTPGLGPELEECTYDYSDETCLECHKESHLKTMLED